jgi:RNA polymerase sigma-70 factor (ECF subfamily)
VNSPADELLMMAVRDGDVAKLGILFERYHKSLYNFFVRLTDNRLASEDLVQEVFLRMLKYRHTYRGERGFRVWMYQIARNARADHFRKPKRERFMQEEDDDPISPELIASEEMERGQEVELLRAALDKLTEDKREVLLLSRFQNLKYEEIAGLLGCAVGTVKARVHRAIKDLRQIFLELSSESAT